MTGHFYVCAGFPATSSRSLFPNLVVKTRKNGLTKKRGGHFVIERSVDRFGATREICSDYGPQFLSQYFNTLCSKIGARSTMYLAGTHEGNGNSENTSQQLRRAVAKALTLKKGTNLVEVLLATVRAWHETTGHSGYTLGEIVFGTHIRTKRPLWQSLRRLPKTPCTTSNGGRSFLPLHVEL